MAFCVYCGAAHPDEAAFCPGCGRPTGADGQGIARAQSAPPAYPVLLAVDNTPRHSRLTTFFRYPLLIPHVIVLLFYGIGAWVVAVIAWFAILITGRYPRGMFDFQVDYLRYATRVACFQNLLTSGFPPFGAGSNDDGYPVRLAMMYPDRLSRLKTFFRPILAIPGYFISAALGFLGAVLAFFAWFVILFTGRLPDGMFDVMAMTIRYSTRYHAFSLLLVTDRLPWFQDEAEPRAIADVHS
jgi:hypothetical protein